MIWVILGTAYCLGVVSGMIAGKLFTEREMEGYATEEFNRGYDQGYDEGYSMACEEHRGGGTA